MNHPQAVLGAPAKQPDPATYPERLRHWSLQTLERIGDAWFGNLLTLLRFAGRLARAAGDGLGEIGSRRIHWVAARWTRQFFRTFFRGIVLVAVLGVAGALGIGAVARLGGTILQPLFESVVLVILIRDVAPLGVAVVIAARMGASITAKLAVYPARNGLRTVTFGTRHLNELVVPQLVAGLTTAPLFYLVLGWFILAGYDTAGSLSELLRTGATRFFRPTLWPPLADGAWRAAVFGGVVSFVASALGVAAAEKYHPRALKQIELQDAVWESSVISLVICGVITIVFLAGAGNP